jgi:hypothetical protein
MTSAVRLAKPEARLLCLFAYYSALRTALKRLRLCKARATDADGQARPQWDTPVSAIVRSE